MKRLALMLLLVSGTAVAGPATDAVKKANNNINALLKAKAPAAQLTTAVNNIIAISQLGHKAMGTLWSQLSPAEQATFDKTLNQLINTNYVNAQSANLDYKVNYTGEKPGPTSGTTEVDSQISVPKKSNGTVTIEVDYLLDANLQVFDIITDGSSLVDTYHDMFSNLMSNGGFNNLITAMQNKLQKLQAQPAPSSTSNGAAAAPVAAKP